METNKKAVEKIKQNKWYDNYANFIFFLVSEYGEFDCNIFDAVRLSSKNGILGKPFVYLSTQKLRYYYLIQCYTFDCCISIRDVLDILKSVSKYLQLDINIAEESELVCADCTASDINAIRRKLDFLLSERLELFESVCSNVVKGILKKFKKDKKRKLSEDELFELISQTDMYRWKFEQEVNPTTEEEKQKLITLEKNVLEEVKTQDWYIWRKILIKEALLGKGNLFFKREVNKCVWFSIDTKFAGNYSTDMKNILDAFYDWCVTSGIQVIMPAAIEYKPYSYGSKVSPEQANENIDKLADHMNKTIKMLGKVFSEKCDTFEKEYPGCSDKSIYRCIISETERYPVEMDKAMKEYPEKERQRKIAEDQRRAVREQKEN